MEEDIKHIKYILDLYKNYNENQKRYTCGDLFEKDFIAIENILNELEKLQKESAEWQKAYQEEKEAQFNILTNSIPKKKIEDKIEKEKDIATNLIIKTNLSATVEIYHEVRIQVLQELLEEDEHGKI